MISKAHGRDVRISRKVGLTAGAGALTLAVAVTAAAGRSSMRRASKPRLPEAPEASQESVLQGIRSTYARSAAWHDLFTRVYSLGADARLRRELVRRLRLKPGDTVLDVACGTGANFAAIQEAIGPSGRIIGIDYSEAMLQRARRRVAHHEWRNVTLLQGDAAELHVDEPVDAALSTLAIGLMPNHREVLRRMVDALKPEGRILVADGQLSRRWYAFLVNPVLRLAALPWVPTVRREEYFQVKPWMDLSNLLGWDHVFYEEWLGGTIYVASGSKAAASGARSGRTATQQGHQHPGCCD